MENEQLLELVQNALEDKKAQDIKILDVRQFSSITDFMVIASGNTDRQVVALAQHVAEQAKAKGHPPLGEEGANVGEWILIDLGDVIVHVMQPRTRDFYQLEKLWGDMANEAGMTNAESKTKDKI
jgi:ribosome-associated protein